MYLKKHYQPGTAKSASPVVTHVEVRRFSKDWRPSIKAVHNGVTAGYFELAEGLLTVKTGKDDPDLVYKVLAPPGTYCCHCGEPCPDIDGERRKGKAARAHVAAKHKGKKPPSKRWPAGYAVQNFFMCELRTS